jgi:2-oxoglutarate ferredoxin oxidoreductase subunit delta
MESNLTNNPPPGAAVRRAARNPRGEVFIYAKWCKGCRICVEFCPTQVLAFHNERHIPVVVAPENCTGCHFCDTHCPDLAIAVRRL